MPQPLVVRLVIQGELYRAPAAVPPATAGRLDLRRWPELDACGRYVVPNRADRRRMKPA